MKYVCKELLQLNNKKKNLMKRQEKYIKYMLCGRLSRYVLELPFSSFFPFLYSLLQAHSISSLMCIYLCFPLFPLYYTFAPLYPDVTMFDESFSLSLIQVSTRNLQGTNYQVCTILKRT